MTRTCFWPGCPATVQAEMLMCRKHWSTLPRHLRLRIWDAYEPGQGSRSHPSGEYLEAAHAIRAWCRDHDAAETKPDETGKLF